MGPLKVDPATEVLCEQDLGAESVRDALLGFEAQGHAAGWDALPPTLFMTAQDANSPAVACTNDENWQQLMDTGLLLCAKRGMFTTVTNALEIAIVKTLEQLRRVASPGDLFKTTSCGETWGFHGFGVRYEGWMVLDDEQHSQARAAMQADVPGTLGTRPDRQEVRRIDFVSRDGTVWEVMRVRSDVPTVKARKLGEIEAAGNVLHMLSRMVTAVTGKDVRVPDAPTGLENLTGGKAS